MKRTALALTVFSVSLFTTLIGAQFVSFASGNMIPKPPINYVYIRTNGSIEPFTLLITLKNNVYTLTGDFTKTTLEIERDGIILDGAGYSINGYSTDYYTGVDISNRTNITIKNLVIKQFGTGIMMENASENTLIGNKMTTFAAFNMVNADNNAIVGNTADQGYGIYGSGSYNQIADNNFSSGLSGVGTGMGIYLSGNNNTISRNTIIHETSINIGNSQYNTISYNNILHGRSGILLAKSSNNIVFGNTIKGKTDEESDALYISTESFNNAIFENTFENNTIAISLGAQVADTVWNNVYNNTLYRNNFINNIQNVWIAQGAPVNYWDNGKQGNYWRNYNGADNNRNGIGDTPYVIDANNVDHYPLMNPVTIPELPDGTNNNGADKTGPFPTLLVVGVTVTVVAVVAAGGLVYFKKRKHQSPPSPSISKNS
jgi:parallel beta-helix repeat protein